MVKTKSQNLDSFLRTNTLNEGLKSLEKLLETLTLIDNDIYQWKWALVCIHNSMQIFMTLALEGTYRINVIRHKKKKSGEIFIYLLEFEELYKRIKKDKFMRQFVKSKKFISTERQDKSVNDLASFRNDFIHYVPKSWSIQIKRFPDMFIEVMTIIKFLIFESGNFLYKFNEDEIIKLQNNIISIDKKLKVISYGA